MANFDLIEYQKRVISDLMAENKALKDEVQAVKDMCIKIQYGGEELTVRELCERLERAESALKKARTARNRGINMAEWISVKDRLPESGKDVLVFAVGKANAFIGDTKIKITEYTNVSLFPSTVVRMGWRSPYQYFFDNYEITHWMPLPEPPKEGHHEY